MTKFKLCLISAVVLAVVVSLWVIQYQTRARLGETNRILQGQAAQIAELMEENNRLSQLAAWKNNSSSPTNESLNEILKLRDEVAKLRAQILDLAKLINRPGQTTNTQPAQAPPPLIYADSVTRESYAFAGYATPESGMESMLWAMTHGDGKALWASYSPGMQKVLESQFRDMPEGVMPGGFKNGELYNASGYHVLDKEVLSDEEVVLKVFLEGRNTVVKLKMQNIGGDWKEGIGVP